MSQLLSQLGIDWKLLIAQAVNFVLLFILLRMFVYKPLKKVLHDRRHRIEEGLEKAKEADQRLAEVNHMAIQRIKDAEHEGTKIMARIQEEAKEREAVLLAKAKEHEIAAMKAADERVRAREEAAQRALEAEGAAVIREAIIKVVEMKPEAIDEALIDRALADMKQAS